MGAPEVRKLLVVKLRTLGDVLTTFPLLRALKRMFPSARLDMVADEAYADCFTYHPDVDRFRAHPARALRAGGARAEIAHMRDFTGRLRRERYDVYLDLYGTARTALWGLAGRIPRRLGFPLRARRWCYTQTIAARHRYVVDLNLQFAEALGGSGFDRRLAFFLGPGDGAAAEAHLHRGGWDPSRPMLGVSPGGGWPVKCWAPERFGALARRLREATGCQVVLTGTEAERPLLAACARELDTDPLEAVGLPLRTLAAVIKRCRVFVGNDSGPKYLAEAFSVPTLICYGPTDYINNNPPSALRRVAVRDVPCRPCHSERCREPRRVCLDDLDVDAVYAELASLWRSGPGGV